MYHTRTPIYIIWGGETSNMCFCSPLKLEKMSKIWLTFFRCVSKSPTSHIFFPAGVSPCEFSIIARHWPPQISVATNDLMQGMQVGEPLGFSETSCHDLKRCTEGNTNWAMKKGPVVPGCCCFWGISGMEYFPVNYVGIISNKIQGSILNSHDSMESHRLCFFFYVAQLTI